MFNRIKNFLVILVVLAVAAIAAWNVNYNSQKNDLSDVMLATMDALAYGEDNNNPCGKAAYEYDNDWYEDTKSFRRCGDCYWVDGTQPKYGCN